MKNTEKIKAFLQTDRAMLMGCIGIAFIVWLFMKMSQPHETQVPLDITYTLPGDKIFETPPPATITPKISGTGWALFSRYLRAQRPKINLKLDNTAIQTISASRLETAIQSRLSSPLTASLRSYQSIDIRLDDKAGKKIPVILQQNISLASQYQFVVPPRPVPDSITVFGPKTVIETIDVWRTEVLKKEDIKESEASEVSLLTHSNTEVSFEPAQVICEIDVEQFTQKTLEVPIQIINAPDTLLLTIHPSKTKITCRVGMNNYDKVNTAQFKAVADFTKVDVNNSNYAPVKLTQVPDFVNNTNTQPQNVEFIISQ